MVIHDELVARFKPVQEKFIAEWGDPELGFTGVALGTLNGKPALDIFLLDSRCSLYEALKDVSEFEGFPIKFTVTGVIRAQSL